METDDHGTKEIARQFTVVPKLTRGQYGFNMKIVDETEIDRLLLKGTITAAQHSALEGLMRRLQKAGFVGVRSPDYNTTTNDPSVVADKRANIMRSMVRLFRRMDEKMGTGKRKAMVNLVLMDTPWPADNASLLEAIRHMEDAIAGR